MQSTPGACTGCRGGVGQVLAASEVRPELDAIRIIDAQLRYFFHLNPDELDDITWAARVKELEYIRTKEAERGK